MIRPVTILGIGVIVVLSAALFQLKYEVRTLESGLAGLQTALDEEEESIRVLGAEWSFLNRPSRLQVLSDRYLVLTPVVQPQLRALSDIPFRAPGIGDGGEEPAAAVTGDAAAPMEELARLPARKPFRLPLVRRP